MAALQLTAHDMRFARKKSDEKLPITERPLHTIHKEDLKRGDLAKLSRKYNRPHQTTWARIYRSNWSVERALTEPNIDPKDSGWQGWEASQASRSEL